MKQKITVIAIPITKEGERNFFQISLPRDIDRIVGMQAGLMAVENLWEIPTRYWAGMIKVQAENYADLCFSCELSVGQSSLQKSMVGFASTNNALMQLFTKPEVDTAMHPMRLMGCYTLYGYYEDRLIKLLKQHITYTVRLYIWTETDEPELKPKL